MAAPGVGFDNHSTAKGFAWGRPAQDIAVAPDSHNRFRWFELYPTCLTRQQLFAPEQAQAGDRFGCSDI
jgi:hypothetical protein